MTPGVLTAEKAVADYFEKVVATIPDVPAKIISNWVSGELFGMLNQNGSAIDDQRVAPEQLAELIRLAVRGEINNNTAKNVLAEMFQSGKTAGDIVAMHGLRQISEEGPIASLVSQILANNPEQVAAFLDGKTTVSKWFFGQVMRAAKGQANPHVLQSELEHQLDQIKKSKSN